MTRYFMTIPEAASLVVQAGAIGGEGEIFVLDMGEPVRILELARNMIRLSGKEPDRDVPIEFVGARPGEKLYEELWGDDEDVRPTAHPKILRVKRRSADPAVLERELESLEGLVEDGETLEVVARLRGLVARGASTGSSSASPATSPVAESQI
jgi:FlaA1/EpsC-like NDP-sugar epimerase